jgi:hypothetical protein
MHNNLVALCMTIPFHWVVFHRRRATRSCYAERVIGRPPGGGAVRGIATPGEAVRSRGFAARTLAFDARDRLASIDELRRAIADAQRRRSPATALDLGDWVRARIAAAGHDQRGQA